MAGKIPAGIIATDIKLDGTQPVKTMRELKQAVAQTTSAWKAQQAELRSAGKATEAATAKYKGLSKVMENQRKYIAQLKEDQVKYAEAMRKADTSTKEGQQNYKNAAEALNKTNVQIGRATNKLNSLASQQSKAKKSMDYYKSGLASAQKELRETTAVSRSYVERLQSEGKNYEAAKAKLNGYKSSVANLTKQQKIQAEELKRIASESGATSSAYKRQQVRVNETATSINKLNGKIKASQHEVNNLKPTAFNKITSSARKVASASDKMKASLHNAWESAKAGAAVAATAVGAVGAAAISGAKKAQNLDQRYKEITNLAVNGGEKQKEVTKAVMEMQRQGQSMSIKYGKSQQDIADSYEELVKRGYTTKQALGAMKSELQASVASGDDFKDVVAVSSTTLESFGMRAKTTSEMTANTKRAVNELAYAADMTSTGFKDLGYGMSYVGSSAHSAGFSLSETASAMGILSNNGLEASKAGTGLNQVINRLSNSAGKLKQGDKKNVLAQLGIKPKEIMNSKGQLKSLSDVFGVLNKHMQGMSKVQKINIMKSLFGTTGEQAGLILAKYNGQLDSLSKKTLEAGKNGKYVAELSAKNSETAKMQVARAKQAFDAFSITLGKEMLPAINEAGEAIVVFLTKSKDGKALMKDFAGGVKTVADGLVDLIKWVSTHKTEVKWIFGGLLAGWSIGKGAQFIGWLGEVKEAYTGLPGADKVAKLFSKSWSGLKKVGVKSGSLLIKGFKSGAKGIGKAGKWSWDLLKTGFGNLKTFGSKLGSQLVQGFKTSASKIKDVTKGLLGKGDGAGALNGMLQSQHSAGGFGKLTTAGKIATGTAYAGVAVDSGMQIMQAVKDRHSATKRSKDIGGAIGTAVGGGLATAFLGPEFAPVGAALGKAMGQVAGKGINSFTKGWQRNKPPKNFWSIENLGYSAHNMWKGFTKGVSNTIKWFKKNWKEIGLYFINPIAGAFNSLYKHNKKFHKWVNGLVKGFKNAWKGVTKWFSNLGKGIQKSWKGMTKWFSNLGKNMAKGLKSAWKGMTKWFSNIGKGIRKAWHIMTAWFGKLGRGMSKNLKNTWHGITSFFSGIAKGVQHAWSGMTHFFGRLGKDAVDLFKNAWHGLTGWFTGIIDGIKNAWDGFWDKISGPIKTIEKVFTGKASFMGIHFANGTDWRKRYGVPAILNDGNDSPTTGNREGVLNPDGTVEVVQGRSVPRWLFPWQDVINARDMARLFGRGIHLANGTRSLRSLVSTPSPKMLRYLKKHLAITEKSYNALRKKEREDKKRHEETKRYRAKRERERKKNSHKGQHFVDSGILSKSGKRTGKAIWISDKLYKKLTTFPKVKRKKKKRKTSTRRRSHRSTRRRSRRTYSYSGSSLGSISSSITRSSIRASVSGAGSVKALASAIKSLGKNHKVNIKVTYSGTYKAKKSIDRLVKSIRALRKAKAPSIRIKYSGTFKAKKSVDRLIKSLKGLSKRKTTKLKIKYSGTYKAKKSVDHLIKSLKSLSKWIAKLNRSSKKMRFGKDIAKQAEDAVKSLKGKGNFAKEFDKLVKKFEKDLKSMSSLSKKEFRNLWSTIEHSEKSGQSHVVSSLNSFSRRFKRGWSSLQSGVRRSFGRFWSSMNSAAKHGLSNVLKTLNEAIGKIDNVVHEFGGSTRAVHKVSTHLATGTDANGRLTQDTLAIVNDAKVGPRQEAIVTDSNDVILPKGNDVPVMLKKGWGVLNGTQTQRLGLPHFANGTGLKGLYEMAKKYWGQPIKTGQAMFNAVHGISGALQSIAEGMHKKGEDQGVKWWSQLWKMVEDKVNDGSLGPASGLLKEVEKLGRGKRYHLGSWGPDEYDCSGLVSRAIQDMFHKGWGRMDVAGLWSHAHRISRSEAKPGDPVFWLPDHHVGIYIGGNKYWSAFAPGAHPDIGVHAISSSVPGVSPTFGRFNGISPKSDSKDVSVKADNKLQKLIKQQVGKGFWKTIDKIQEKYGPKDGGSAAPSGSHKHWMEQAGIPQSWFSAMEKIINGANGIPGESHWDPKITNPTSGAYGIPQSLPASKMASAGSDWRTNPITQLKWMKGYIKGRYGNAENAWRHKVETATHWYANGGIANTPSIFGEAGSEMAIPLVPSKASRAWELVGKTVGILSSQSGLNQNQQQLNEKESKEEHDLLKAMLLILQQMNAKSNDVHITLTTPNGRTLWEVVQPYSKQAQRADAIKSRKGLSNGLF